MGNDKFIEKVLAKFDPNKEPVTLELSADDKLIIEHAVAEEAGKHVDKFPSDADLNDFKMPSGMRDHVEKAVAGQIDDATEKSKAVRKYVTLLLNDYTWTVRNSRIIRRLNDSIKEFKTSLSDNK